MSAVGSARRKMVSGSCKRHEALVVVQTAMGTVKETEQGRAGVVVKAGQDPFGSDLLNPIAEQRSKSSARVLLHESHFAI